MNKVWIGVLLRTFPRSVRRVPLVAEIRHSLRLQGCFQHVLPQACGADRGSAGSRPATASAAAYLHEILLINDFSCHDIEHPGGLGHSSGFRSGHTTPTVFLTFPPCFVTTWAVGGLMGAGSRRSRL